MRDNLFDREQQLYVLRFLWGWKDKFFKVKESTVAILSSCFIRIIRSFMAIISQDNVPAVAVSGAIGHPLKRDGFYRDILANVSGGNCHNYDPFTQLEMFWT